MVEKLSEIGVSSLNFIQTKRTERDKINYQKLNNIALQACKQSGNPYLMQINEMQKMEQLVMQSKAKKNYIASLQPNASNYLHANENAMIWIGPEGDFTEQEYKLAADNNFIPTQLNKQILKTETAAMVAASLFLH
jgi:16S rRNA (uracil1498-N3)-methyltransferase